MSVASSSTEMPDLTRRTLDWDRTSLLRGMSREEDRVIFCVMGLISATGAGRLSLGYQPVTKTGAALFLSGAPEQARPRLWMEEGHAALRLIERYRARRCALLCAAARPFLSESSGRIRFAAYLGYPQTSGVIDVFGRKRRACSE